MTRRDFLRTTVPAVLLAVASAALSGATVQRRQTVQLRADVRAGDLLLRAAPGAILASAGGDDWRPVVIFAPGHALRDLWQQQGVLYARLDYQGLPYILKSPDTRLWYTLDYVPPQGARIGTATDA